MHEAHPHTVFVLLSDVLLHNSLLFDLRARALNMKFLSPNLLHSTSVAPLAREKKPSAKPRFRLFAADKLAHRASARARLRAYKTLRGPVPLLFSPSSVGILHVP
jgi:hypothetical protein